MVIPLKISDDLQVEIDDRGNILSASVYVSEFDDYIDCTERVRIDPRCRGRIAKEFTEWMFDNPESPVSKRHREVM